MPSAPLLIVSGPSGSGKSTVIARLLADTKWPLHLSVSATTRPPRPGEIEGVHYYFWDRARFEEELRAGAFLEWAEVHGNYYGTLKREVEAYRAQGEGVILDIDVQGAAQVRVKCPDSVSVFLHAASLDRTLELRTLEERLRKRHTEDEASIQRRLAAAGRELACAGGYDYQVINDDVDSAVAELRAILQCQMERGKHVG